MSILEIQNSLSKIQAGDHSDVPPYLSPEEWADNLSLQLDNTEMAWCKICQDYHWLENCS